MPAAEALAAARRREIAAGAPPRGWAGFAIWGPSRAAVSLEPPPRRWELPVAIAAVGLLFALGRVRRRAG